MKLETKFNKKDILSAYEYRHASKEFDPNKKISEDDFNFILETGRLSPSSFGFEPWKFIVIQNEKLREKLKIVSSGGQKQIPSSSHFVIILSRTKKHLNYDSDYIQSIMKNVQQLPQEVIEIMVKFYKDFIKHDIKLVEGDRLFFEWGARQTYIALGNMMTSAAMIGIDSCPMEGFNKKQAEKILKDEGIMPASGFGISSMVTFGYRIENPLPKKRQALDEIVEWVN
ncbi:NAD(P)H-dependent oxidoreductase [Chengkuizengella axinellae]|uniref:NAD(P)H-dependent oxidoreductase n=1 Tax=Chengkuizengella axinellae TaxID=3064388 RepID=A0ABT9J4K2_9BACL|nr:NAD(P)H-dependent oxidoreductase [Chengkuizengella sp. 2205SS18-9]MDP5276552.1 NAD(P)H-dependent oxidoreductase [Chengkuizengella sp. 2205SS18-9]